MSCSNKRCLLLGHRAARAEVLENSEQGFVYVQNLQKNGKRLDGVEFDIQMTADGEFVVVHDETLKRLSKRQCWICDNTLDELTAIHQSDFMRFGQRYEQNFLKQKVLLLKDLLSYLQNFNHIELEIKTHAKTNPQVLVKNLIRLLSSKEWQKLPVTLTSFDTEVLYQTQNQQQSLPFQLPTGLLLEPKTTLASQIAFLPMPEQESEKLLWDTFNLACRLGCGQVGIYYALITPKLVDIAKRFDLKVTVWTVNDVDMAEKLIAMGVDCVITDYPTEFLTKLN